MFLSRTRRMYIAVALFTITLVAFGLLYMKGIWSCSGGMSYIDDVCCVDSDDDGLCDLFVSEDEIESVSVGFDDRSVQLYRDESMGDVSERRFFNIRNMNSEPVYLNVGCEGYDISINNRISCVPWIDQPDGLVYSVEVMPETELSVAIYFGVTSEGEMSEAGNYTVNVGAILAGVGNRSVTRTIAWIPVNLNVV